MATKNSQAPTYESVMAKINKDQGSGTLMMLGDNDLGEIDRIPCGVLSVDLALGGGWPRGKICEQYGGEGAGKTSLALLLAAQVQKRDLTAVYLDVENAMNKNMVQQCGVDIDTLGYGQPNSGESTLEVAEALVQAEDVGLIIIDSVSAMTPQAEIAGDFGDSVSAQTPVYVRNSSTKVVDIVPIEDLYHGSEDFSSRATHKYTKTQTKEVLTHQGWKPLQAVWKKLNVAEKPLVVTRTSTGYVQTTPDHCLFVDGEEKKPGEIELFDRLDTVDVDFYQESNVLMNEDVAWLLGFYVAEGSTPRSKNHQSFSVSNTDESLILECQRVVEENFCTKSTIRITPAFGTRQDLYVLDCLASPELGFWMQECITEVQLRKRVPRVVLHSTRSIKKAFLEGFWQGDGNHGAKDKTRRYHNDSLVTIAGVQYLLASMGIRTNIAIGSKRPWQVTLVENPGRVTRKPNEVMQFYEMEAPEFVYDLSTEAGTFVTAIGNTVVHNSHVGLQARMMSQGMRKLNNTMTQSKSKTIVVFINQIRTNIGFSGGNTTSGGKALKFYASVRLDVAKISQMKPKPGEDPPGHNVKIKVVKNRTAPPLRTATFDMIYDRGISNGSCVLDMAVDMGLVKQNGAYYTNLLTGEQLGQGRMASITTIENDADIREQLSANITSIYNNEDIKE